MRGALSDERTGLSFTTIIASSTFHLHTFTFLHVDIVPSQLSRADSLWMHKICSFTCAYVTLVYVYVLYIQDPSRSSLRKADHALTHVAHVTTAA
jgi:hypothetical protein